VQKVVRAIDPQPGDVFIEIGPGRGALTRPLATRAQAVVAFEIDRDLVPELRATVPANVTVIEGDFLDAPADRLPQSGHIRVAGNLPYNVASPILFKLLALYAAHAPLSDATVMLQREVADRLVAKPGTREFGVLSVLVGHSATVARVLSLPPGAFRPPPKVHSSVVTLQFHAPEPPIRDRQIFAGIVQAAFTRRRKTLANALSAYRSGPPISVAGALAHARIDGRRRPETLSIEEFARLSDVYAGRAALG